MDARFAPAGPGPQPYGRTPHGASAADPGRQVAQRGRDGIDGLAHVHYAQVDDMTLPRPKRLSGDAILMAASIIAILVAIAVGRYGVETMLPLSAILAFAISVASPMRGLAWTAIRVAFGSLAAVELTHAAHRLTPFETPWVVEGWLLATDVPYYGFTVMLAVGLLTLPHLRTPRWSLLVVPFLLFAVYLFARDANTNVFYFFPILELILLALSLPALEGFLRGPASPGRVLLTSGLAVRALASFDYVWTLNATEFLHFVYLSFLVGNLLLAVALWLEVNELRVQVVIPSVATLFGFQVVLGSHVLVQVDAMGRMGSNLALSIILYTQVLAVLALVLGGPRHPPRTGLRRHTTPDHRAETLEPSTAAAWQPQSGEGLLPAIDRWVGAHAGGDLHVALIEVRWMERIRELYGRPTGTHVLEVSGQAVAAALPMSALVTAWDDSSILALWPARGGNANKRLQDAARKAAQATPDPLPRALELRFAFESAAVPSNPADVHRWIGRLDAKLGLMGREAVAVATEPASEPVGRGT